MRNHIIEFENFRVVSEDNEPQVNDLPTNFDYNKFNMALNSTVKKLLESLKGWELVKVKAEKPNEQIWQLMHMPFVEKFNLDKKYNGLTYRFRIELDPNNMPTILDANNIGKLPISVKLETQPTGSQAIVSCAINEIPRLLDAANKKFLEDDAKLKTMKQDNDQDKVLHAYIQSMYNVLMTDKKSTRAPLPY